MRLIRNIVAGWFVLVVFCQVANADKLIGEYRAFISESDLYNSAGERLTEPWQVIRQDRANYHQFELRDPEDQYDSFFAVKRNRELLERLSARARLIRLLGK